MAKAVTDEQLQLRRRARRRLVGAIALVTVIAVVLPWVLDSEPQPAGPDVSVQIPSPNAGEFASRFGTPDPARGPAAGTETKDAKPGAEPPPGTETKASPPAKAASAGKAGTENAGPASATTAGVERKPNTTPGSTETLESEQARTLLSPALPRGATSKDKGSGTKATAKAVEKAPTIARDAAAEAKAVPATKSATEKGYIVQVGALADPEKAKALQEQLAAKGLPAYTESVETSKGTVTRVRVGPFPGRDAAEQSRERLKSLGFEGNVAPR